MTQEDYICNRKVQFDGGNEFQLRLDEGAMIPVMTILGVCNPNRRKMMCHIFAMPSHISCEQPSILCCVLPQFVPYFLPCYLTAMLTGPSEQFGFSCVFGFLPLGHENYPLGLFCRMPVRSKFLCDERFCKHTYATSIRVSTASLKI